MARGQQKIQSQQKAAEKAAKLKKMVSFIIPQNCQNGQIIKFAFFQQGNSKADNIKAAAAGLKMSCTVCKSSMPDPKTYRQVKFKVAEVKTILCRVGSVELVGGLW